VQRFGNTLIGKNEKEHGKERMKVCCLIPCTFDLHIVKASVTKQTLNSSGMAAIVVDVKLHNAT